MSAIRRIVSLIIFAISMCVFYGSAMAFDLGGVLKQVEKAAQQMGVDQNTPAQPSNSQANQGRQISAQGSVSPSDSPKNAEEYCQKISTNPSIIQLAEEMRKLGKDGAGLRHTYLDNDNGDLEKWVADNFSKFADSNMSLAAGRTGKIFLDRPLIKEMFGWVQECYAKNSGNESNPFIVVAKPNGRVLFNDSVPSLEQGIPQGKISNDGFLHARQATLLAFLFPGVENVISSVSPEVGASFRKAANEKLERDKQAKIKEDKELYGGLRAVYTFRGNPAISASYNECVGSEKEFRLKNASKFEAEAKNANTVAEQNKIYESANFVKKNIEYIAHGYCIYRLNVGLKILETNNELAAVMTGDDMRGREDENLNTKYTATALNKVATLLSMPAEKFNKTKIEEPFKKAMEELDSLRPVTRSQQQEIEAQKMIINLGSANIHPQILGNVVKPFIEGKIQ